MDVPKHALRPTLVSAIERIETLKEARKEDAEKIKLAIKELRNSAKREQTLKSEIERMLDVEKTLKQLLGELKATETKHSNMITKMKELEAENATLRETNARLSEENAGLKEESKRVRGEQEEQKKTQLVVHHREVQDRLLESSQILYSKMSALEEAGLMERDRGDALVQTVLDLHEKHNKLVQIVRDTHQEHEKDRGRIRSVLTEALENDKGLSSPLAQYAKKASSRKRAGSNPPPPPPPPPFVTPSKAKTDTIVNMETGKMTLEFTVRPHAEYGLCCKLIAGFVVSRFRELPGGQKGPMETVGLLIGDRIIGINGETVGKDTPVVEVMNRLKGERILHLKVVRDLLRSTRKANGADGSPPSIFVSDTPGKWQQSYAEAIGR
jgi:hypothetical protein